MIWATAALAAKMVPLVEARPRLLCWSTQPPVASAPGRVGGVFLTADLSVPLGHATKDAVLFTSSGSGSGVIAENCLQPGLLDARTKSNVAKTTRVLKMHILKQSANTTSRFLGLATKSMTMVFTLRKFPSSLKALQISLPHPLAFTTEGLFIKTAKGKRILSVQFGRGDMEEDALTRNGVAVIIAVRKNLDANLVREITVDVDRLALPVYNRKLSDRGRQKLSARPDGGKRGSMAPPVMPPLKRVRIL